MATQQEPPSVKRTVKSMLLSKKFIMAVMGIVVVVLGHFGIDLNEDQIQMIVGLVMTYIIGQGIADAGKEAVIVSENPNRF